MGSATRGFTVGFATAPQVRSIRESTGPNPQQLVEQIFHEDFLGWPKNRLRMILFFSNFNPKFDFSFFVSIYSIYIYTRVKKTPQGILIYGDLKTPTIELIFPSLP